jgi:hypothetical protein
MISDNQMDEWFNDRLRDYPSSVPADMWDRIMAKKKRDRMIWWFFGLFAIGILAFGLRGGYSLLHQKRLVATNGTDHVRFKRSPVIADTLKTSLAKLPSGQEPMPPRQIESSNTKANQQVKRRRDYLDNLSHAKINASKNLMPSQFENKNKNFSTSKDSINAKENDKELKKDSPDKKLLVKTPAADSSHSKDVKKPETTKKPDNGKWFLDVYASPDYPIISPRELEQSKLSYSIGIKINRSLGKHFSLKTGILFSQVNIGGDDSLTYGTTLHLMRLDLPVLAGYSLGNEDLRTTFNGGLIFNLYTWLRGSFLEDFFKTNTGLSFYLGVNFDKKINEKISLFMEPYYRYQLTPLTVSSIDNMKFIDVAGLSIGARYYFKK